VPDGKATGPNTGLPRHAACLQARSWRSLPGEDTRDEIPVKICSDVHSNCADAFLTMQMTGSPKEPCSCADCRD
jgi:hypothetical protein